MRYLLIFLFILFSNVSKSQVIKGEWYGWGNVDYALDENNYMIALEVEETSNGKVEGYLTVFYMDERRVSSVIGVFDRATQTLLITNVLIPMHFKDLPNFGKIDIEMAFTSKLINSRTGNQIRGTLTTREKELFNINFVIMRPYNAEGSNNFYDDTPAKISITEPVRPVIITEVPEQRKILVTDDIPVTSDSLSIDIYDGSVIDGDSISVYYNDRSILQSVRLSDKPVHINLRLDPNSNTHLLVLKAENLGTIPPNTGVMIVHDGSTRKEVHFSNNFKVSSGILFSKVNQ